MTYIIGTFDTKQHQQTTRNQTDISSDEGAEAIELKVEIASSKTEKGQHMDDKVKNKDDHMIYNCPFILIILLRIWHCLVYSIVHLLLSLDWMYLLLIKLDLRSYKTTPNWCNSMVVSI
eukprot:212712_1